MLRELFMVTSNTVNIQFVFEMEIFVIKNELSTNTILFFMA